MEPGEIIATADAAMQLLRNGQGGRTEFELGHLLLRNPGNVYVLAALSEFYYLRRDMRQAANYARKAASLIVPGSALSERLYASRMLSATGEDELANEMASQALDPAERHTDEVELLADHLRQLGLIDSALMLYDSIGNAELSDAGMASRGMAMLYASDIDASRMQFAEALTRNPGNALAAWQLAMLDVPEGRDRRVDDAESLLPAMSEGDQGVLLRLALFNECDLADDAAKAFRYLEEANDLVSKSIRYDVEMEALLAREYQKQLRSMAFGREEATDTDAPIPIFIIGLPRTGTTLLEKSIAALADVQAVGEHLNFRKSIEHQLGLVFGSPFEIANRRFDSLLDFDALGRRYRERTLWRTNGRRYYTDKETSNYAYAGLIAKALPDARIIHIRRNPMDACFSGYKQMFGRGIYPASYSLDGLARYYRTYEQVMAFWRDALGPRLLEIRYEDLVLNHDRTVQVIKDYCRFNVSEISSVSKAYKASTLSAAQVQKPIHAGNINAWAKYREYLKPLREALDAEYTAYMGDIEGVEIL
jgi:Sulfotransferase family